MKASRTIYWSPVLTGTLFLFFYLIFTPALNSADDFFLLYTLSGGGGQEPTNHLHYIYTLHPLITWPIPILFKLAPAVNWYSVLLVLIHFISCATLLYTMLILNRKAVALLLFLLFFIFIESRLLLSLNYSNASLSISLSGLLLFLVHFMAPAPERALHRKRLFWAIVLIITGGLLRAHMLGLCAVLTGWMALFLLPRKQLKPYFAHLLLVATLMFLLAEGHKLYYQRAIPQWDKGEQLRQSFFYAANRPQNNVPASTDSINLIKSSLVRSFFIYDSTFTGGRDIEHHFKNSVRTRSLGNAEDRTILYWTVMNEKVYFALLFLFALFFLYERRYSTIGKWLLLSLPGIALFMGLFLFMKITEGIFIALYSNLFFSAILCAGNKLVCRSKVTIAWFGVITLNVLWMLFHLHRISHENQKNALKVSHSLKVISNNPGKLFINIGPYVSFGDYSNWETPTGLPAKNLLYAELIHTNNYQAILQQYKIKDLIRAIPTNPNVLLLGEPPSLLKEYYQYRLGWTVGLERIMTLEGLNVFKVKLLTVNDQ